MRKKIVVGILVVITILFLMPSIQALQTKSNNDDEYRPIKFITFNAYAHVKIENLSGVFPVPPGGWVSIPLNVRYFTKIPVGLKFIPWPFNNLFLFYSFYRPMQKIWLDASEDSEYIDVVFSDNPMYTPIIYEGEEINISSTMYIFVAEDTPIGWYRVEYNCHCEDIGRIIGDGNSPTLEFLVDYY
jgi:hypothetical protein